MSLINISEVINKIISKLNTDSESVVVDRPYISLIIM